MARPRLRVLVVVAILCFALLPVLPAVGQVVVHPNPGFETGDLSGWDVLYSPSPDYVEVMAKDSVYIQGQYAEGEKVDLNPNEGSYMARLGRPDVATIRSSTDVTRTFDLAAGEVVTFAYNLCTYDRLWNDGGPEDQFYYRVRLTTANGDVILDPVSVPLPTDNPNYALWCTGWREVTVPLDAYSATSARLDLSVGNGGTSRATWAYVDAQKGAQTPTPTPTPTVRRVEATVAIAPNALNPNGGGNGPLTAYVELPAGDDVSAIQAESVLLTVNGVTFVPAPAPVTVGDRDGDGVLDRAFTFDRGAVLATLPLGTGEALCTLSGKVGEAVEFSGTDTLKVVGTKVQATATAKGKQK